MLIISIVTAIIALLVLFFVPSGSTLFILLLIAAIILAVIAMRKKKKENGESTVSQGAPFYSTENNEDEKIEEDPDEYDENGEDYDEDAPDGYEELEEEPDMQGYLSDLSEVEPEVLDEEYDEDDGSSYNLVTDEDSPIVMEISDVFGISGRSSVLCGKLEYPVNKGDSLNICASDGTVVYSRVVCMGIERNHKRVDMANEGDNVGLLFAVDASPIERGMLIRG